MKLMKQLFSSLFIAGAMLSTQALAEEKQLSRLNRKRKCSNKLLYKLHHKLYNKQ